MATTLVGSGTLGNMPNASGLSGQNHLVYGVNSDRWFLFTNVAGDTTHINCYVSSSNDLNTATWATIGTGTQSPTVATLTANEGRELSIAYANIASTDVVYVQTGTATTAGANCVEAIRVTLTASVATWGTWVSVASNSTLNTPSGACGAISTTGRAWLVDSRITSDHDTAGVIASNVDAGTSWTSGWGAATTIDNSQANTVNSGAMVALASGLMLLVADSGAVTATTTGHVFKKSSSSTAWPANSAGTAIGSALGTAQNKNDWNIVGVSTTDVHFVRRTSATGFEHRRFNGTDWTTVAGSTPLPTTGLTGHLAGSGIHLATDGTDVWAFVIDTDANKTVKYIKWTASGNAWNAGGWTDLGASDTGTKANLGGWTQAGNNQIGVVWTENASTPFAVVGSFLSLGAAATIPPGLGPGMHMEPTQTLPIGW